MAVRQIKLGVGKSNVRASTTGSTAALSRHLRQQLNDIEDGFDAFIQHMEGVAPEVLVEALQPTFEKSKEYCPKDTLELVNSGYLEVVPFRKGARVEMGYARGGKPYYAIYVHEMPYEHKAPTRRKFLEAAVDEDYFNILPRAAQLFKYAGGL